MADEQDRAEALDDDKIGEPAPDHLLGAQAYGAAGAEPHAVESVAARAGREEPEDLPLDPLPTASTAEGPLSEEDIVSGDETLRDVAQEREAPIPAEEAALHVVAEDGFEVPPDEAIVDAVLEADPESSIDAGALAEVADSISPDDLEGPAADA
jgi:hypothetical protein